MRNDPATELEHDLSDARQRNAERLRQPRPKRQPRWKTETSPAQVARMETRISRRLAHTAAVPALNPRSYSLHTGRQKPLSRYGLTTQEWGALVDAHGSRCAICGRHEPHPSALAIDHDHATGKVRGLLCRACNTGLGQFRDSIAMLEKALAYLRKCA